MEDVPEIMSLALGLIDSMDLRGFILAIAIIAVATWGVKHLVTTFRQ